MTGDGILAAVLFERARHFGACPEKYKPYPSSLKNYTVNKEILDNEDFQFLVDAERGKIGNEGRVFIRASGTEPVIRVLVEARTAEIVQATSSKLDSYIVSYMKELNKNI
jgi:Phosphomannomutase